MVMRRDISTGVDPVPAFYDIIEDAVEFNIDGKIVKFANAKLPFTLVEADYKGYKMRCADKALVLRHANG